MKKSILIITLLLLALTTGVALAQTPEGKEYTVQADDWLSKIAEKEYGDPLAYPAIAEATNAKAAEDASFSAITDPNVIEAGQKLWLPVQPIPATTVNSEATTMTPPPLVGIDSLCGESALSITALDKLPEDATTKALDTLLRQIVTLPTEEFPGPSAFSPMKPAPGAVIFVDSPERRYFRSTGVADITTCRPFDPAIRFPIGSNTKMMTAAVIYQLHEEGLLSTSDLVSQYLPDEIALWAGAETITIDMLLGHTSGLPDYLNSINPATVGGKYVAGEWDVLGQAFTPQELVAQSANEPLLFTPGAAGQYAYSNTGYVMLGQIIEQVTGKSYTEAVTERIFDRLGMKNTSLIADVAPAELGLTQQYLESPFTVNTSNWSFSQGWAAGNAVSTPEDMAIFLRALFTGALYQNPDTLTAMLTRAAPGFPEEADDYHYMHGSEYKAGFLGHGGQTLGTVSNMGYHPATDTVIVTWANSSEALTGFGIYHVGHALGLTPTWDEVGCSIPKYAQSEICLSLNK